MLNLMRCLFTTSAVLLSACSSIPITSMYKLSRIDFMTTDLRVFRFALAMPSDLRPLPGGVHMDLAYSQGDKPEEKRIIKLEESLAAQDFIGLPNPAAGQKIYVYRLPPSEVATLNKIRADAAAAKTKGQKGSLTMGITAKEFCTLNKIQNAPLLVTTFVLSSENADYVVLTRDVDLRGQPDIATTLGNLAPCK
jgi:hypothetical protein